MTRGKALKYVFAKAEELGYNTDLSFEVTEEIYEMLATFDNTEENLDKFVERVF